MCSCIVLWLVVVDRSLGGQHAENVQQCGSGGSSGRSKKGVEMEKNMTR